MTDYDILRDFVDDKPFISDRPGIETEALKAIARIMLTSAPFRTYEEYKAWRDEKPSGYMDQFSEWHDRYNREAMS